MMKVERNRKYRIHSRSYLTACNYPNPLMDATELQIDVLRRSYAFVEIFDFCWPSGGTPISCGILTGIEQQIVNFWPADSEFEARDKSVPGACTGLSGTNYGQN